MQMTIYAADCRGRASNSIYPHRYVVTNADEFKSAIVNDHVCALFKNHHRATSDFIESDVVVMDCDNDHSDNPDDWVTPESLNSMLEGVTSRLPLPRPANA